MNENTKNPGSKKPKKKKNFHPTNYIANVVMLEEMHARALDLTPFDPTRARSFCPQ